jgi:collagenase-like PrtC family protease
LTFPTPRWPAFQHFSKSASVAEVLMAYVRLESFMHGAICTRLSAVSFIARYYTPKRRSKAGACAGYWWQTAKTIELVPDTFSPTEGSSLDKRSEMCKLLVWQDPKKSLHSRIHTTSSNEVRRSRGTFPWVRGVRKWERSAGF